MAQNPLRIPGNEVAVSKLQATFVFFFLIWVYIIIRSFTVFYIHDEIVTKWAYMVSWNPWPYQGYIDANNHFLNSFLGGAFIRLFNSDAMWIVRLGNVLSFPLFFWSLYGMRRFFHRALYSYLFIVLLTCTPFVLEFFGMARGYGISIAFMALALLQMMHVLKHENSWRVWLAIGAWLLAVYANLTLLPMALFSLFFMALWVWLRMNKGLVIPLILAVIPLLYLVQYGIYLGSIGKLYYGGQEGFFPVTVHSILKPIWFSDSHWIIAGLVLVSCAIFFSLAVFLFQTRSFFQKKFFFLFYLLSASSQYCFNTLFWAPTIPRIGRHYFLLYSFLERYLFSWTGGISKGVHML